MDSSRNKVFLPCQLGQRAHAPQGSDHLTYVCSQTSANEEPGCSCCRATISTQAHGGESLFPAPDRGARSLDWGLLLSHHVGWGSLVANTPACILYLTYFLWLIIQIHMSINPRSLPEGLDFWNLIPRPTIGSLLPFPILKGRTQGAEVQIPSMCTHPGRKGCLGGVRMDVTPALQPEVWMAARRVVDKRRMFLIQG